MSSLQIGNQKTDHLLTPENSAVIGIDPGILGVLAGMGNGVGLSAGYNQKP